MVTNKNSRSSWEESADKFLKVGGGFATGEWGFQGVDTRTVIVWKEMIPLKKKKQMLRILMIQDGIKLSVRGYVGLVLCWLHEEENFILNTFRKGMEQSGNNRKKKDKKGFEKVLMMADQIGLSQKEVSKHDLNMVVNNRPHQGLVLDASPLEMVSIKELEPVSVDEEGGPLWVALDEVTDPQNLGAIIRSAYFFGTSGVVLCAKNSAPLSGVVSKASAGSLELMELRSCKNMMQFLMSSANNG